MSADQDGQRVIGEYGAKISHLTDGQARMALRLTEVELGLNSQLTALRNDVHAIREMFAEMRGGWRVVLVAAAAIGVIGSWIANVVFKRT